MLCHLQQTNASAQPNGIGPHNLVDDQPQLQPVQQPPQPLMQLEGQLVAQLPAQQPLLVPLENTLQQLQDFCLAISSSCFPNPLIRGCQATQLHQLDDIIRYAEFAKGFILGQLPRLPAVQRQRRQVRYHALHPRITNVDADMPFCISSLGLRHEVT